MYNCTNKQNPVTSPIRQCLLILLSEMAKTFMQKFSEALCRIEDFSWHILKIYKQLLSFITQHFL